MKQLFSSLLVISMCVGCGSHTTPPTPLSDSSLRHQYERAETLSDEGKTAEALALLYETLDRLGSADSLLLRRDINEQIASQFLYKGLADEAMEYVLETIRLDSLLGDSVSVQNALFAKMLQEERGVGINDEETRLAVQGLRYEEMGDFAQARRTYQKMMSVGGLYAMQYGNMKLVELSLREGDMKNARRYMQRHREWMEVVRKYDSDARSLLQMHVLRKDSLNRVAIAQLNTSHRRTMSWLMGVLAFLSIAILFLVVTVRYHRQKRILLKFKLDKLQALMKEASSASQKTHSTLSVGQGVASDQKPCHGKIHVIDEQILARFRRLLNNPEAKLPTADDWRDLSEAVNDAFPAFPERLFDFCKMSTHDYHVCLLLKVGMKPSDIARLTAHSDEAITSSRRRLFHKAFGKKGTPKDWDDFIQSL